MKLCIDCGEFIHEHAKLRCRECFLEAKRAGLLPTPHQGPIVRDPLTVDYRGMNKRFCLAMLAARKHPHPEWRISFSIGVSKVPGTQRPVVVGSHHDDPMRSASAWMESAPGGE